MEREISDKQYIKELQKKLRENTYSMKCRTPTTRKRFKSSIWDKFENIIDENQKEISGFVVCKYCKIVHKYDSAKLGTRHLLRHNCVESCNAGYRLETLDEFVEKPEKVRLISEFDKKSVKHGCLRFVVKDTRPMYAVEGEGLANLLSTFTSIGQKYGKLSPDEVSKLVMHPTTVSVFFFLKSVLKRFKTISRFTLYFWIYSYLF